MKQESDINQLKEQQNRLRKIEKEMTALSRTRDRLEQRLGEQSLYAAENREDLEASLAEQAENSRRLAQVEEEWLSLSDNPIVILLVINFILLFVGVFMDMTPAVLIFTPIFLPILSRIRSEPCWRERWKCGQTLSLDVMCSINQDKDISI